jgi:hypothetical protein
MKSLWDRIGNSMQLDSVSKMAAKIKENQRLQAEESKLKEQQKTMEHQQECQRLAVFGKKSYQAFRG